MEKEFDDSKCRQEIMFLLAQKKKMEIDILVLCSKAQEHGYYFVPKEFE